MDFQSCGTLLRIYSCLFSHSIKIRGLPLSEVTVSLYYSTCQDVCVQQSPVLPLYYKEKQHN